MNEQRKQHYKIVKIEPDAFYRTQTLADELEGKEVHTLVAELLEDYCDTVGGGLASELIAQKKHIELSKRYEFLSRRF